MLPLFLAAATGFGVGGWVAWGEGVVLSMWFKFSFLVRFVSVFYYYLCATAIIHRVEPGQVFFLLFLARSHGRGGAGAFTEATFPTALSISSYYG